MPRGAPQKSLNAAVFAEILNTFFLNVAVWLCALTGFALFWFARGNRPRLIAAGVIVSACWISGTALFTRQVLGPLETAYISPPLAQLQQVQVKRVVVLTGGGYPHIGALASTALPHASTFRFVAGMELCRRLAPDCQVIFSGSAGQSSPQVRAAETMQEAGQVFAPAMKMASEANSNSTAEHPRNVKPFVGAAPFALVTSAYHMPRAMRVFERAGLKPIPYPVDFYSHEFSNWTDLIPEPQNWQALNLALHEYAGLLAYSMER